MIILPQSLTAWGDESFKETFKAEAEQLGTDQLPLQQALELSSYVSEEPFKVMVIDSTDQGETIRVKAGVFYSGIIAGCNCSDDPTPPDVQPEYCDLEFTINKQTGESAVVLL